MRISPQYNVDTIAESLSELVTVGAEEDIKSSFQPFAGEDGQFFGMFAEEARRGGFAPEKALRMFSRAFRTRKKVAAQLAKG